MAKKTIPAISIIIATYNAEKYLCDTLDSILAQTFDDYEVIIVDDCSTDNSCAVVESYLPRFTDDGLHPNKLRLIRLNTNSGGCVVPINTAIKFAHGDYLAFLGHDDAFTATALSELYDVATKFNADVIHCEKYYIYDMDNWNDRFHPEPSHITSYQSGEFVKIPTLISNDLTVRINDLLNHRFIWNEFTKLIRREFILKNNIELVGMAAEDVMFTCCLVCTAERYVRVPNIVNFYRVVPDSLSHKKDNVQRTVQKWVETLTDGLKYMDVFLDKSEFFQHHTEEKYKVFEFITKEFINYLLGIYSQVPAYQLDAIIRNEFAKAKDITALSAFFFSRMNVFNVNLIRQSQIIRQQQAQIQQLQAQLQQQAHTN